MAFKYFYPQHKNILNTSWLKKIIIGVMKSNLVINRPLKI